MAKRSYFSGKGTKTGNNRSHALNSTRRTFKPNLQKVRVLINGRPRRVWATAREIKSGKFTRI